MWWRALIGAFWISILLVGSPTTAYASAEPIFTTEFPSEMPAWQEVHNAQFFDPDLPCRGPYGEPHWNQDGDGFGIRIEQSVPCRMVLLPPIQPLQSDLVEVHWGWFLTDPQQDRNLVLSWQDADNYLGLHLFGNQVFLENKQNGIFQAWESSSVRFDFQANTTYDFRVRVDRRSGRLWLWVNEVLILHTTTSVAPPWPFLPGLAASVGHGVNTSESYFTFFTIWDDAEKLEIIPWKQSDVSWAAEEYDTASDWSREPPTLERWGCALTVAAITLEHYGITTLPNQTPLTPARLNAWLISQPDGYVGPGLVSWRALTRLAKWHADTFGTPALELKVVHPAEEDKLTWLREQLENRRAVILEVPGHFVVATAHSDDQISIHDPLFQHTTLSDYSNTYLSARLFEPSYTDLQGAIILVPPWATLRVRDWTDQEVPLQRLEAGYANSVGSGWHAWDVGPWGQGDLSISTLSSVPAPIIGWLYDHDGQATPIQPTHTALTEQDLAALLSWEEIRSPVIVQWRRILLDSDQTAHQVQHYHWLLRLAAKNDWLSHPAATLLIQEIPLPPQDEIP